ncbi:16S rRNA (guanine(527)-N(7))-methyltransferase RsmG [Zobellella denitrificans]|uniref:Ribosomal RNA small subunit methyltransferase G n=1 Tax=Zobellella denitrificans TaxID=347534 RepID=A0A231N1F6_9GAMM|nr:16S rRNA (guanine(527)-N(7))-methyltransferase RsmG [Zobellella denitrificans]ATG75683.1 16S rRNA methyltransferase [Zobellella denitrificans]OXS16080.1 16S rRNA (guanine(527)-N(7))-methyltransferase RsmG [Zobellella denitrificans]
MREKLQQLLARADLPVGEDQQRQLLELVALLHKWNKAYNLTSVRDPEAMLVRHIMDSLVVSPYLEGERFIDVGTGPGLPGLPLAIVNPDKQFVLLDSLGKRIRFIRMVVHHLGLTNVEAVQSRVEAFNPEQKFDGVLSRAFASLDDMLSWCAHLPGPDGRFLALKGQYPEQELQSLPAHLVLERVYPLAVPEQEGDRHLVVIRKSSQ